MVNTYFTGKIYEKIKQQTGKTPTDEECKAVAHHMEYNVRADKRYADNGKLKQNVDIKQMILKQMNHLHRNDIPRYVQQYRQYKAYQKNWKLNPQEEKDLRDIAQKKKKVSDFSNKDYLKNLYIKYLNQRLMPEIKKISMQEKNNLQHHGLWHTEQVALFAIDIAVEENMNPLPCLLAAALHDCARTKDSDEPEHAENCEPIAQKFLNDQYLDKDLVSEKEKNDIIYGIVNHNNQNPLMHNNVLDCLQDADSMRLFWSGRNYKANTPRGRMLKYLNPQEQIRFTANMLERMRATRFPKTNNQTQTRSTNATVKIDPKTYYEAIKIVKERGKN